MLDKKLANIYLHDSWKKPAFWTYTSIQIQFLCFTVVPAMEYRETWVQIPVLSVTAVHHCIGYLTSLHLKCKIQENHHSSQLWELNEFWDMFCLALSLAHSWQPRLAALCRQGVGATLCSPEITVLCSIFTSASLIPHMLKNSYRPGPDEQSPPPTIFHRL